MEIKLTAKYTDNEITIKTNTDDPDQIVTPEYAGKGLDEFKEELGKTYGIYGHILNPENTTNSDLRAAANKMPNYYLVSATPIGYPRVPEGVQT